jgi:Rad3-related DNA helicase
MNAVYERLAPRLTWLMLKQGDLPRQELVRRFKDDGLAVLFGVKSFWEGVDVQGEALSMVIIDKLPFPPPDDPVWEAKREAVNRRKGDDWAWFHELAIPSATIALKQGFGRLIRTKSDRGVVALLDGRLSTMGYGSRIVKSLPPATQTRSIDAVKSFFGGGVRPSD